MDSFIVMFWEKVFGFLKLISLFQLIRKIFPSKNKYKFVEIWVLSNLLTSLGFILMTHYLKVYVVLNILFIYGIFRVFEIIVYQVNVLLFDPFRDKEEYKLNSYKRTVILLLHNFIEIIFWFAASYKYLSNEFTNLETNSILYMIYTSFCVMTGFGSTSIEPSGNIGIYIIWGQSFAGLFMTLISLARFIGLLPSPKSMDESENKKD